MKLCRSIMIKGLEALIIDCAAAAERWDVENEVFASLGATFPSVDWRQLAQEMPKRVRQHGIRRAAEMREAAQMLEELGLSPRLSLAVADQQQAHAGPKP
jgi:3-hydroxyisobutyrate dehydrogenase-like beta-hydroxyacid dehydrogenase